MGAASLLTSGVPEIMFGAAGVGRPVQPAALDASTTFVLAANVTVGLERGIGLASRIGESSPSVVAGECSVGGW